MTTREAMLRRIRTALADVPADEQPEQVPVPREYLRSHAGESRAEVLELFAERVADYRATVRFASLDQLPTVIGEALAEREVTSLVVPDGFPADWLPAADSSGLTRLTDSPPLSVEQLDAADGVVTTAAVGIAVPGTLVLDAGPGQGRRVLTLLPDYHLCVIRAEQIVGDVPEAVAALDVTRPLTFISGPSATSDIELDRVEGVHGPRTLDVVIVTSEEQQ